MLPCKEKFAHVTCNLKPLASTRNSQLYIQQQRNIPKAKVMISEGLSKIFCLWSFLDKKLGSALQRHYFTRHSCLFNYFSSLVHVIFSQGQTTESLRFCLKSAEQVGNFNC